MIRTWKSWSMAALVVALTTCGTSRSQDGGAKPSTEVSLKTIKYQGLIDAVKAAQGNVVVVDVWATYCVPCKKEFPNFVKLHDSKGKDGVVCISVTIDDKENREAALKYLQKQNATMTNFWLDEPPTVWGEKWKVKGVPVVFVFDKKGKPAKKFTGDDKGPNKTDGFTYDDVNKVVDQLLKPDF